VPAWTHDEALQSLLKKPDRALPVVGLLTLRPEDETVLLNALRETRPVDRWHGIVHALAAVGGSNTVAVFARVLTNDFAGKLLPRSRGVDNDSAEGALHDLLRTLGRLARSNDVAYAFVRQAAEPGFWDKQRLWKTDGPAGSRRWISGEAVKALGYSVRPEIPELLNRLSQVPSSELACSEGAIAEAAFLYDLHAPRQGREAILAGPDPADYSYLEQYRAWTTTGNGRRWQEWFELVTGITEFREKQTREKQKNP
jgi:hypothetical protein